MTSRKPHLILPENAPKQDEIDHLREFAAELPKSSYLASLFSVEMLDWCETRIRNDFTIDLYAITISQGEDLSKARNDLQRVSTEADIKLTSVNKLWNDTKAELFRERTALDSSVEELKKDLREARVDLADERRTLTKTQADYERIIADLHNQVTTLKAEVYDLHSNSKSPQVSWPFPPQPQVIRDHAEGEVEGERSFRDEMADLDGYEGRF